MNQADAERVGGAWRDAGGPLLPGVLTTDGDRVLAVRGTVVTLSPIERDGRAHETAEVAPYWPLPDVTDPATLGCMLAAVREAWGDPHITVAYSRGFDLLPPEWACIDEYGRRVGGKCPTEAEALLAAWVARPGAHA